MKKTIFLLLILGLSVSSLSSQVNLLQNPGFEDWTGGMPDNWINETGGFTVLKDSLTVHGGIYSAACTLTSTSTQQFTQCVGGIKEGGTYTFSFYVYDDDTAGRARVYIRWYNAAGGFISGYHGSYTTDSTEWQYLSSGEQIAPVSAESAHVEIRMYDILASWDGDAVFYIDDASFVKTIANTPPIITNVMHRPTNPDTTEQIIIRVRIIDDYNILYDSLYIAIDDTTLEWTVDSPDSIVGDIYYYHIDPHHTIDTVYYYIWAEDDSSATSVSPVRSYLEGKVNIVINEVYYNNPGSDTSCFIELKGDSGMSLDGYTVVGVNGNGGTEFNEIDLTGHTIPGDRYFVIGQDTGVVNVDIVTDRANMQNGPDNIVLKLNDIVVDGVGYGDFTGQIFAGEWSPTVDVASGHSIGRSPDGKDTDDNSVDFADFDTPTPGELNTPTGNQPPSITDITRYPIEFKCYPNPVSATPTIYLSIPEKLHLKVRVYDTAGRVVKYLADRVFKTGKHTLTWNGQNDREISSGVYFVRMESEKFERTLKVLLVK